MYPEDLPSVRIDFVMIFIPITYRFLPIFTPIVNHFFVIWKQKFFFYFEQIFIDFRTDFIPIFTDLYVNFYSKVLFLVRTNFVLIFMPIAYRFQPIKSIFDCISWGQQHWLSVLTIWWVIFETLWRVKEGFSGASPGTRSLKCSHDAHLILDTNSCSVNGR